MLLLISNPSFPLSLRNGLPFGMFLVGRAILERNMDFMTRVLVGVSAAWIPTEKPHVQVSQ